MGNTIFYMLLYNQIEAKLNIIDAKLDALLLEIRNCDFSATQVNN